MSENQSNKQTSSSKKSISWIIGVITLILSLISPLIIYRLIAFFSDSIVELIINLRPIYFLLLSFLAIYGFIKGIIEFKKKEKKLAILGMALCLFGLAISLLILFFPFLLFFYIAD